MAHRLLFLSVLASGCAQQAPTVPDPGASVDAGIVYADVVVSFSEGGMTESCLGGTLACDAEPGEACGPQEVLGAPDSVSYALESSGHVDLGFLCGTLFDRNGTGADVKIWSEVTDGSAVVEVSEDGTTYEELQVFDLSNQEFDLSVLEEEMYIRFLRIVDSGGGSITIDAVQGL